MSSESRESEPKKSRHSFLYRTLFLDVLFDRRTRPMIIYVVLMIVLGAAIYHWLEGWSYLDALYFSVISLATIGYGDLTPTTPEAKIFTILYVINGIAILLALFDRVRVVRSQQQGRSPIS